MQTTRGFFTTLRASRKTLDWFVMRTGAIRARLKGTRVVRLCDPLTPVFCPLTGAVFHRTKGVRVLGLGDASWAAKILKIDRVAYREDGFEDAVVHAADDRVVGDAKLRARILLAVGLPPC